MLSCRTAKRAAQAGALAALFACVTLNVSTAQPISDAEIARLRAQIEAQQAQLDTQAQALAAQREMLRRQQQMLDALSGTNPEELSEFRGGFAQDDTQMTPASPQAPVGEPPPPSRREPAEFAALPEFASVLTRRGRWAIEPSFEYTRSSANRLVFRGVEIVTGVQIGVIEASDADRDTLVGSVAARYGLTDRLELEARVPYVYRHDRVTTLLQQDEAITRELTLDGADIGDVELSARYQLNDGSRGAPIFLANLRLKTDTGSSPFETDRDEFGVLEELPTGSGFWAIEPGLTMLYPSDPAVLYANLSYLYHAPEDIDRTIGDLEVGRVDPGDSISAGAGFGFALNQRFSYSLGYRHTYVQPTETEIGGVTQESESLHVGAFTFGMSYRVNERITTALNYEFGVTSDAPDMRLTFRTPIRF